MEEKIPKNYYMKFSELKRELDFQTKSPFELKTAGVSRSHEL